MMDPFLRRLRQREAMHADQPVPHKAIMKAFTFGSLGGAPIGLIILLACHQADLASLNTQNILGFSVVGAYLLCATLGSIAESSPVAPE